MSLIRPVLVTAAISGIILYSWALYYPSGLLLSSLPNVLWLMVSIIVILGFVALFILALHAFRNKNAALGRHGIHGPMLVVVGVVGILTCLMVLTILNVGVGSSIRSGLPFLPHGNLLVTGGSVGWTYLILFMVLTIGLLFNKLSDKSKQPRSDQHGAKTKVGTSKPSHGAHAEEERVDLRAFFAESEQEVH